MYVSICMSHSLSESSLLYISCVSVLGLFVLQGVQLSNMDHFWLKIRRAFTSISFKVMLPESPGGNGGQGGGGGGGSRGGADGLLKLRDDVKMCGYRDVEVMWNMLSRNQQTQQAEFANERRKASATTRRPPKRRSSGKQRAIWRLSFWSNNHSSRKS